MPMFLRYLFSLKFICRKLYSSNFYFLFVHDFFYLLINSWVFFYQLSSTGYFENTQRENMEWRESKRYKKRECFVKIYTEARFMRRRSSLGAALFRGSQRETKQKKSRDTRREKSKRKRWLFSSWLHEPAEAEGTYVDAARSPGGDRGRGDPKDALHPGGNQVRHPERHSLRQHSWQIQENDDPRGGRPPTGRGIGCAWVLLWHQRQSVQSAHEEISECDPEFRGTAQTEARS